MRKTTTLLILILTAIISYVFCFFLFNTLRGEAEKFDPAESRPYDLVIKHVLILDGTGKKEIFRGDIACRDGDIVEVGTVMVEDCPLFDAGGLTVMPYPVKLFNPEAHDSFVLVEHLLQTSYPRYSPNALYFQDEPYLGFNLAQIAAQRGQSPAQVFAVLKKELPGTAKVYLLSQEFTGGIGSAAETTLVELAATLTSYPALVMGQKERGVIKPGCCADLYFFVTREYDVEKLKQLFSQGKLPDGVLHYQNGQMKQLSEDYPRPAA